MIRPNDMHIKNPDILRGLMERNYHPFLVNIICDVGKKFGVVLTESYRDKLHDNDLHGTDPVRAIDIREWCYSDVMVKRVESYINQKWEYDPNRPKREVVILHKVKGGAYHFHIQVHPRTRRR